MKANKVLKRQRQRAAGFAAWVRSHQPLVEEHLRAEAGPMTRKQFIIQSKNKP